LVYKQHAEPNCLSNLSNEISVKRWVLLNVQIVSAIAALLFRDLCTDRAIDADGVLAEGESLKLDRLTGLNESHMKKFTNPQKKVGKL